MDFRLGPGPEEVRRQIRAFVREHYTEEARERERLEGNGHDWELFHRLAERGWVSAAWPREVGGGGRDPYEMLVFQWELGKAEFPWFGLLNNSLIGRTLLELGSEWQRREVVPRIVRGEILVSLGYSEPNAGSDVASVQTAARRDGDGWVVDGQKMFTTQAHLAQYVFALTRTNREVPKHRGLTVFLIPTDAAGVEIQPIRTIGGERTNAVYLSGVRVSDELRVGEVDGGWKVVRYALGLEQGVGFADRMELFLERARAWAMQRNAQDERPLDDPRVRERLARASIHAEVARLLRLRVAWLHASGRPERGEGPMAKLFSAEKLVEDVSDVMELLGPMAVLRHGEPRAVAEGFFEEAFRSAPVTRIYGGSNEILRSQIAEGRLGLPRTR
jgi:alkylation response protein AidB-like acyl-CoA dehydrogenase